VKIITQDSDRLADTLRSMSKHGVKFAEMKTINDAAFLARRVAQSNVERKFINRTTWSKRSISVNKANTRALQSSVGSTEDYLRKQELGGSERATGRHGVAIPTAYSSGEGMNRVRRRLTRKPNRVANLNLKNSTGKARGRKQQNLVKVRQAAKSNNKVIYMKTRRGKGLFRVIGGKRRPKVKMIHDLSRKSIRIRKRPWLHPATRLAAKRIPKDYKKNLLGQIQLNAIRQGLRSR